MERLTGNDALGLMEAYSAVHQPTINEEQIWEEVETWVNGLVEEGYDLGDYTWEDMYEAYLSEYAGSTSSRRTAADMIRERQASQAAASARQRSGTIQTGAGLFGRGFGARTDRFTRGPEGELKIQLQPGVSPQSAAAGMDKTIKFGGRKYNRLTTSGGVTYVPVPPGAGQSHPVPTTTPGATQRPVTPGATQRPVTPGATQRPVTPGATQRPVTPGATQRPVTPSAAAAAGRPPAIPASPPAPRSTTTATRPPAIPASPPAPRSTTTATPTTGIQPVSVQVRSPMQGMPTVPSMAAPVGGPQLSARIRALQAGGPQVPARARVLNQSFDPFDVVMGHLIDEGYAETEEDAAVIMANMSEEWKHTILEGYLDWFGGVLKGSGKSPDVTAQQRADMYAARQRFANVTGKPLPAAQSQRGINQAAATQSMRAAVEKQYDKDMSGGTWKEPINTSSRHARANTVRAARANMTSTAATSRMPRGVSTGGLLDIRPVDSPNDPMPDIVGMARRRAERQFQSRQGVGGV